MSGEVGPLVIRPGGELRRVSIREAILHKSYTDCGIADRRLITVIEAELRADPNTRTREDRHKIEMYRRSRKITEKVKGMLLERIGVGNNFSTDDPIFREVCAQYGYSPGSLIGSLVKYQFVAKVGRVQRNHRNRRGVRLAWVYAILPQH